MATPPALDPVKEKQFVFGASEQPKVAETVPMNRVSISTRMRADLAVALKRASLERQLQGVEPNTVQDILEEAIEPWLRSHRYIP